MYVANDNAIGNVLLMNVSLQKNWNDRKGLAKFKLSMLDLEVEELSFIWDTSDHNSRWVPPITCHGQAWSEGSVLR